MKSQLVWQRRRHLGTIGQINAVVLSPCALYRQAWKSLLASLAHVDLIQTAATVLEISLPAGGERPATILVDAPGSEHLLALQLGSCSNRCYALFVVNDYDLPTILPLLKLGVTGFTARDDPVTSFMKALLATARGQIGLPLDVANRAMTELTDSRGQYPARAGDLTRRETEVLQLLTDGKSNRDIAQSLFLSVRTVEAHLRSLYGKLDVGTRTEAVLWAVRNGYAFSLNGTEPG